MSYQNHDLANHRLILPTDIGEESPLMKNHTHSVHNHMSVVRRRRLAAFSISLGVLLMAVSCGILKYRQSHSLVNGNGKPTTPVTTTKTTTFVAFVGNSMFYFNDFPRFFTTLAGRVDRPVVQNSCLHGGGSIPSLLTDGNAMSPLFATEKALIGHTPGGHPLYDYGACSVPQLMTGRDEALNDPTYTTIESNNNSTNKNPCREDAEYLEYAKDWFAKTIDPTSTSLSENKHGWNYAVINDNTVNPSRAFTRSHALRYLETSWVPLLLETGAIPVFLWTHAYSVESTQSHNMTGLEDVANFTSLTGVGYRDYAELLEIQLPASQQPRIAPVGLAFLMVHEERPDVWSQLFHSDHIHASPSGSFLQSCIIYHTLFGEMPNLKAIVKDGPSSIESLWTTARVMQHPWEPANPFPSMNMVHYLYRIAERIMVKGEVPKTYIDYQNHEAAETGSERKRRFSWVRSRNLNA